MDPDSNLTYYYNIRTQESIWEPPPGTVERQSGGGGAPPPSGGGGGDRCAHSHLGAATPCCIAIHHMASISHRGGWDDRGRPPERERYGGGRDQQDRRDPNGDRGPGVDRSRRAFVGNLAWVTNADTLGHHFSSVGRVVHCEVLTIADGPQRGKSKGCGIVEFENQEMVQQAIERLMDTQLDGRRITVRRDQRPGEAVAPTGRGGRYPSSRPVDMEARAAPSRAPKLLLFLSSPQFGLDMTHCQSDWIGRDFVQPQVHVAHPALKVVGVRQAGGQLRNQSCTAVGCPGKLRTVR